MNTITLRQFMRMWMPLWILLYCAAFHWSYVNWISPVWSYAGLDYRTPDSGLLILAYALPCILGLASPRKITRPSQVIYWFLFFTVYVPSLFVSIFVQLDDGLTLFLIQLSMTGGMLLVALSYKVRLLNLRRYPLRSGLFWSGFMLLYLILNAVLLIVFHNDLHFAGFKQVYEQRFAAKKAAEEAIGITYVASFLGNVMNPLVIAYGLKAKHRWLAIIGAAGQVLIYATAALKSILISPLVAAILYFSLKKDKGGWATGLAIVFAAFTFLFAAWALASRGTEIAFALATVILVRSAALPGLFVAQYQYFFEHFPHTYLGHVTGISWLLSSHHELPTGIEIGGFFSGWSGPHGATNANANFFAMDGIAGFGLVGIPIISVLCGFVFWGIDSCARKYNLPFAVSALTMCMISLTNAGLFTSLITGGLIAWLLLFVYMPQSISD